MAHLLVEFDTPALTHYLLTHSELFQGDYAAARMYYQRALLLSPGSKLLKENLAKLDRLEKKVQGT